MRQLPDRSPHKRTDRCEPTVSQLPAVGGIDFISCTYAVEASYWQIWSASNLRLAFKEDSPLKSYQCPILSREPPFQLNCLHKETSSCSSQPSIVHWLSRRSLFPCLFVICHAMVTTNQISIFIGTRSDHSLPMSVTNWLTDSLTNWRHCWGLNELT